MDALLEMPAFLDNSSDSTSIYIVGGEGNWSLTEPMSKMTNLGNGNYVDTLTINAPIYFVFADGSPEEWNNDWPTFSGNYRYGPAATTTITTGTIYTTAKRDNNYSYFFTGDGSDYLFTFNVDNNTFMLQVLETQPVVKRGDVDGNGMVDIDDVALLISVILGNNNSEYNSLNSDLDGDNVLSIDDVTLIIAMILGN